MGYSNEAAPVPHAEAKRRRRVEKEFLADALDQLADSIDVLESAERLLGDGMSHRQIVERITVAIGHAENARSLVIDASCV